jgi:hypothetical protein
MKEFKWREGSRFWEAEIAGIAWGIAYEVYL